MKTIRLPIQLLAALGLFAAVAIAKADDTNAPAAPPAPVTPSFADPSKLTATAPESFQVQFDTTKGKFTVEVTRSLSPIAFFRVIPGFMCQFGIHGDPAVSAKWRDANIADDPVKGSNTRGTITYADAGPNTRSTQFFINFGDNVRLDSMGFSPFGKVIAGMDVVDKINSEYGEGAPQGMGPDQGRIQMQGNAYLKKDFPNLDYIKSVSIVPAQAPKQDDSKK